MRYQVRVRSEEAKDFGLLLQIDANATFLELHNLIMEACDYDASQMASFFTLNETGQRLQEISLLELSSEGNELNEAVMDVATLAEFLGRKIKKMEYQYDFFGDRYFILDIEQLQKGEQEQAVILLQKGRTPEQLSLEGFEGLDFTLDAKSETTDYEKYLSSFDDCKEDDIDYQSLEDWEDDDLL